MATPCTSGFLRLNNTEGKWPYNKTLQITLPWRFPRVHFLGGIVLRTHGLKGRVIMKIERFETGFYDLKPVSYNPFERDKLYYTSSYFERINICSRYQIWVVSQANYNLNNHS